MPIEQTRRPQDKAWKVAKIRDCLVDRDRREVTRHGTVAPIEPRVFDALIYLIEHRGHVVSKGDILRACWGEDVPSDGALARAVMKLRRALGDEVVDLPLIRTIPRVGYELTGDVEFPPSSPKGDKPSAQPDGAPHIKRVALLPIVNATGDRACDWAELGLISLLATALGALTQDVSVVPFQDTFTALRGVRQKDSHAVKQSAIEAALGSVHCVWGELSGTEARFTLHFNLRSPGNKVQSGTVFGSDPAKMAIDAAQHLQQWLAPHRDCAESAGVDLGDPFLNEVLGRAFQCNSESRYREAHDLLEVLRHSGVEDVAVALETARTEIALDHVDAERSLQRLIHATHGAGSPSLQVASASLLGTHLELGGRIDESIHATLSAVDLAHDSGLEDLTARLMVTCAGRMAMGFDERADAMLSKAIQRAERLGNRVLLCDAYCVAGRVAGFRNDWNTALQHQLAAVAIANKLPEAARSWAYGALSWVQGELGQLNDAVRSAEVGLRAAQLSGAEPQLGLVAGQAALAYLASRKVTDMVRLLELLRSHPSDRSISMLVARDVYCGATLLSAAGRSDEALAVLATAMESTRTHPRLLGRCQALQLRVLLQAGRFGEIEGVSSTIRSSQHAPRDRRLRPNVIHATALRDHLAFGKTAEALAQLHDVIRTSEVSEAHAMISLDAAWIHLERGEVTPAAALVASLHTWLEQSPAGCLVAARLLHAQGDWNGALRGQRTFTERYGESATAFHGTLLDCYEGSAASRTSRTIPRLSQPVSLHWAVPEDLRVALEP